MPGIRGYFDEKKRIRQNWAEILENNRDVIDQYDPECRYYGECLKEKKVEKKVLYESGKGRRQFAVLTALFEEFTARPDFKDYHHVWVVSKWGEYRQLKKEWKKLTAAEYGCLPCGRPYAQFAFIRFCAYKQ